MKFNQVTWYSKLFALILFITLPFIGFWLGMNYQRLTTVPEKNTSLPSATTSAKKSFSQTRISIETDQVNFFAVYQNGTWKYSGTVQVNCADVSHQAIVAESYPEQVRIELKTQPPGHFSVESCPETTAMPFSGEVKVSQNAKISVFLDGKEVK